MTNFGSLFLHTFQTIGDVLGDLSDQITPTVQAFLLVPASALSALFHLVAAQ
jgi:hypothetical protein